MREQPARVTPSIRSHAGATLLVIAGLMIAPAWSAMSSTADDQDACRIGAVSPEEYRTIAAEVAAMPPIDWDAALAAERQEDGVAAAVHERLEQVLSVRASMDEQVAAMQAVMRSIGAEFGWATRGSRGEITAVNYSYRLDVNRIGLTRLLSRWAEIVIWLEIDSGPDSVAKLTRVVALMPQMWDPGRPGWKKPSQERPCPPMPLDAPTRQERTKRLEQQG